MELLEMEKCLKEAGLSEICLQWFKDGKKHAMSRMA